MNIAPSSVVGVVLGLTTLVVGYMLLLRRLADVVQPIRLDIAEVGEKLLASSISERRKAQVAFYLDNAFNGLVLPLACLLLPAFFIVALIKIVTKSKWEYPTVGNDERKISGLFTISVAAANPVFALVFLLELVIFMPVLFLASGQSAVVSTLADMLRAERSLPFMRAAA